MPETETNTKHRGISRRAVGMAVTIAMEAGSADEGIQAMQSYMDTMAARVPERAEDYGRIAVLLEPVITEAFDEK